MTKNISKICLIVLAIVLSIITYFSTLTKGNNISLQMNVSGDNQNIEQFSLFYLEDVSGSSSLEFSEAKVERKDVGPGKSSRLVLEVPNNCSYLKLVMGDSEANYSVSDLAIYYKGKQISISDEMWNSWMKQSDLGTVQFEGGNGEIAIIGENPYLVWDLTEWNIAKQISSYVMRDNWILRAFIWAGIILILLYALKRFDTIYEFPAEIVKNKTLIWKLSKSDFKQKYAGSYLGTIWAFVNPIVTVLVYWFVFEKGLRSGSVLSVPFVLWLIAGLVPWFYFSDALNSGTSALLSYQYLVKKVVFQIDILPVIKVMSSLFVHAFFVLFTIILYACYGYFPDLYLIQILYYSLCVSILVIGLTYMTSSVVVFFRDLAQIIGIVLQVGVWMTPIMWNMDTMSLPGWLKLVLKLNPMYYVTAGYRDALVNKVWFWEKPALTMYFWIITGFFVVAGCTVFKKLKIHFADVL